MVKVYLFILIFLYFIDIYVNRIEQERRQKMLQELTSYQYYSQLHY